MKCEDCSHAEMCKWIDELEGRGCDFYDDKPCELLILKSDILLHQDDRKKWAESIKREKESGVIILPPYFEPLLVPNDIEINIEQEPCDDAISREAVLKAVSEGCQELRGVYGRCEELINALPSVTQKPIEYDDAISRDAAIEAVKQAIYNHDSAIMRLTELPSVNPQSCDDAIDREYLFKVLDDFCGHDRTATITLDTLADIVYELPSVTQKSGKWIKLYMSDTGKVEYECSKCTWISELPHYYCPNCGAKMESEE